MAHSRASRRGSTVFEWTWNALADRMRQFTQHLRAASALENSRLKSFENYMHGVKKMFSARSRARGRREISDTLLGGRVCRYISGPIVLERTVANDASAARLESVRRFRTGPLVAVVVCRAQMRYAFGTWRRPLMAHVEMMGRV